MFILTQHSSHPCWEGDPDWCLAIRPNADFDEYDTTDQPYASQPEYEGQADWDEHDPVKP